jgi:hypothetical protein
MHGIGRCVTCGRDPHFDFPGLTFRAPSAIWTLEIGALRSRCTPPLLFPAVRTVDLSHKIALTLGSLLKGLRMLHQIPSCFLSTMDHEKLQVVVPQIFEYDGPSSTASPEPLNIRPPSIDEPEYVEDRRERRGESVWYENF